LVAVVAVDGTTLVVVVLVDMFMMLQQFYLQEL
jgi:hypothetical protein